MLTSDFDFSFPESQIALHPLPRGEARLMVIGKNGRLPKDFPLPVEKEGWAFGHAKDLIRILKPGDALALNDTKVLRARLHGRIENGSTCEVLLIKSRSGSDGAAIWECLAKPGKKLTPGKRVEFAPDFSAEVIDVLPEGERILRFNIGGESFFHQLEQVGAIPLPPYIRRTPDASDAETYQSVFAEHLGSVAAPTASLHFSQDMLDAATQKGVRAVKLTLHVGAGTFRPVQTEKAEDHPMHSETFSLSQASADTLNTTHESGGHIFAVGTTASRVLETCAEDSGLLHPRSGETNLFVYPGYSWKTVDALLTNFHWPRSTLFMLICGMIGTDRANAAYSEAIRRGFRLFSYGDAMLIL